MKDFSLRTYEELLEVIRKTDCPVFTMREYFTLRQASPAFFVLRHDVDRRPKRALRMALVEKSLGIRSTYYFRMRPHVFMKSIVEHIASMGHEIGYHYEVLVKAKGEFGLAERIFTKELAEIRSVAEVKTASMHGNPLSRWDNRRFWTRHQPAEFGLEGEAYISMQERDMVYLTDTGRGWNRNAFNVRDRLPSEGGAFMPPFRNTWELMRALAERRFGKVYLQVHPNRWTTGTWEGYTQCAEDMGSNIVKRILSRARKERTVL